MLEQGNWDGHPSGDSDHRRVGGKTRVRVEHLIARLDQRQGREE